MQLTEDFRSLVLNNTPLLDVRAAIEFKKGAFATSTNIPILTDRERELVGTMYKEQGNKAAVTLAEELIKQEGKQQRVTKWKEYINANPQASLYCFRGGQRSTISQIWLKEVGVDITRLKGGYKAFRNYLMQESLRISAQVERLIIGGRTGSGKTILLKKIPNSIDLEDLAHHRGSSFGGFIEKQPAQIDFENNLAYKFIQFEDKYPNSPLIIEHESHNIGKAFIPKPIYTNLMNGKLILLETPIQKRVEIIFEEYIKNSLTSYVEKYSQKGVKIWANTIENNINKIQKRIGSELYKKLQNILATSLKVQVENGNLQGYKELIEILLISYYDPMYDYQIAKSKIPTLFKGNQSEILQFLNYQLSN